MDGMKESNVNNKLLGRIKLDRRFKVEHAVNQIIMVGITDQRQEPNEGVKNDGTKACKEREREREGGRGNPTPYYEEYKVPIKESK